MSLGSNIKALRDQQEMTLEQLSEISKVEVGTISALENRNSERSKFAPQLAEALGVPLSVLVGGPIPLATALKAAEPDAVYLKTRAEGATPSISEALDLLSIAIAAVPPEDRDQLAAELAQWGKWGGKDTHRQAVLATLSSTEYGKRNGTR